MAPATGNYKRDFSESLRYNVLTNHATCTLPMILCSLQSSKSRMVHRSACTQFTSVCCRFIDTISFFGCMEISSLSIQFSLFFKFLLACWEEFLQHNMTESTWLTNKENIEGTLHPEIHVVPHVLQNFDMILTLNICALFFESWCTCERRKSRGGKWSLQNCDYFGGTLNTF
jgi:hypothetical protein